MYDPDTDEQYANIRSCDCVALRDMNENYPSEMVYTADPECTKCDGCGYHEK